MKSTKKHIKSLDLGTRKVSSQNFSKIVTLPKMFTENFLGDNMEVKMTMTASGKLTLVAVKQAKKGEKS